MDYHLKMTDATHLIINGLPYRKITPEEYKKTITEAINVKLQELDFGLAIADQYESIRENYITLVDQLNNGEISWYYFVNTIDDARSERIGLLSQARELQNSSYDPNLHEHLVKALTYAVNYCEACYFAGDSYSEYMQESYLNDASNYVTLLQKSMDNYRKTIKKEQEKLVQGLPKD
ncbi:MAG: hypothetical protein GX808_10875 [Syntrophomonadaceae bacterium]|nr:hypothetical protein [Syntrophomonadaceae bacterium]